MGAEIRQEHFSPEERDRFLRRLDEQLIALESVLSRGDFSTGPRMTGVELELSLIDAQQRALAISDQIVNAESCDSITPELGAFDIELGTPPALMKGKPFSAQRASMQEVVERIQRRAASLGGRAVPISVLPTLQLSDFGDHAITNQPRYRALARELRDARRGPFKIAIRGSQDELRLESPDIVAMEAANTAYQVHLSVAPDEFADLFNAALLCTGPVIAAAANSPTFLGRRLWMETRVALFKQAGDDRPERADHDLAMPPRVNFGHAWVRQGAHELFRDSVALHAPLLSECSGVENCVARADRGQLPNLRELRLHHGTVWSWTRPVYDPTHGGSLRIELRALPAGPSLDDMLANGAFLLGAMLGLKEQIPHLIRNLPFTLARRNFFDAARLGLEATLCWPSSTGGSPRELSAKEVLLQLLPAAYEGLRRAEVETDEAEHYLGIFEARVRSGVTGATWQLEVLDGLEAEGMCREAALDELVRRYAEGFDSGLPVHRWPL